MWHPTQITSLISVNESLPNMVQKTIEHEELDSKCLNHDGQKVLYTGPDLILGDPVSKDCLTDIPAAKQSYYLDLDTPYLYSFEDAHIIGWDAAISRNGNLYASSLIANQHDQDDLVKRYNPFYGFVLSESESRLSVKYQHTEDLIIYDTAFFLGALEPKNYGSFLFRFLPKLLFLKEIVSNPACIVVPCRTAQIMEMCSIIFPCSKIIECEECIGIRFKSLNIISSFDSEGFFSKKALSMMRDLVRSNSCDISKPKKIFVSRLHQKILRPHYRPLINENDLLAICKDNGFEIFYPELHTVRSQMSIFESCEVIAGISGSGMLNSVFANNVQKIIDYEVHAHTVRAHSKTYSSIGSKYIFVFGKPTTSDYIFGPWELNTSLICDSMDYVNNRIYDLQQ